VLRDAGLAFPSLATMRGLRKPLHGGGGTRVRWVKAFSGLVRTASRLSVPERSWTVPSTHRYDSPRITLRCAI